MPQERIPKPNKTTQNNPVQARQMSELEVLIRARYPLIYVVSWEEQRLVRDVVKIASRLDKAVRCQNKHHHTSCEHSEHVFPPIIWCLANMSLAAGARPRPPAHSIFTP